MEIAFLLQKYAKLDFSQKRTKEIILKVFNEEFAFDIEAKDVEIKDTEIKLKISGTRRTHFILQKNKIEESIQNTLKSEGIIVSNIY